MFNKQIKRLNKINFNNLLGLLRSVYVQEKLFANYSNTFESLMRQGFHLVD